MKRERLRFPSERVVTDDPLRLLRVYRFSAQLEFEIPDATIHIIREHKNRLPQVSPERIRDELIKILDLQNATSYLRRMDETRLLSQIIPEIEEIRGLHHNELNHCLLALEIFEAKPISDTLQSYRPQIEAYLEEELIHDLHREQILKLALLLRDKRDRNGCSNNQSLAAWQESLTVNAPLSGKSPIPDGLNRC